MQFGVKGEEEARWSRLMEACCPLSGKVVTLTATEVDILLETAEPGLSRYVVHKGQEQILTGQWPSLDSLHDILRKRAEEWKTERQVLLRLSQSMVFLGNISSVYLVEPARSCIPSTSLEWLPAIKMLNEHEIQQEAKRRQEEELEKEHRPEEDRCAIEFVPAAREFLERLHQELIGDRKSEFQAQTQFQLEVSAPPEDCSKPRLDTVADNEHEIPCVENTSPSNGSTASQDESTEELTDVCREVLADGVAHVFTADEDFRDAGNGCGMR